MVPPNAYRQGIHHDLYVMGALRSDSHLAKWHHPVILPF